MRSLLCRRAGARALACALAVVAAPASAAELTYEECLSYASSAPEAAREQARLWELEGGGSQARHCGAIALSLLGAGFQAAMILSDLGATATDLSTEDRLSALESAGDLFLRENRPDLAKQAFARASELGEMSNGGHIGLGIAEADEKNWDAAIAAFGKAIEKDANDVEALTLRASAYRSKGDAEKALEDARLASDIARGSPISWFERGAAAFELGLLEEARESFLNAARLDDEGYIGDMARVNLQRLDMEQ